MPSLSTQPNRAYPSIPNVDDTIESHTLALQAIKDAITTHERRDNNFPKSFIRYEELVELGIINEGGDLIFNTVIGGGGSGGDLGDLDDVDITNVQNDDIIQYNTVTSMWENGSIVLPSHTHPWSDITGAPPFLINITGEQLKNLGDVEIETAPQDREFLVYDSTDEIWINQTGLELGINDQIGGEAQDGDMLYFDFDDGQYYPTQQSLRWDVDGQFLELFNNLSIHWVDLTLVSREFLVLASTAAEAATEIELLADMEGSDGSTSYTELSPNAANMSFEGGAELDTAQFNSIASSLLLDGVDSFGSFPNISAYDLGTQAWTIEGFVRFNSLPTQGFTSDPGYTVAAVWGPGGNQFNFEIIVDTFGTRVKLTANGGSTEQGTISGGITLGVWYHWAVARDVGGDGNMRAYFNGVAETSDFGTAPTDMGTTTEPLRLGSKDGTDRYLDGWIDDVRWTLGTALYTGTGGFSPPSTPFTVPGGGPAESDGFKVGNILFETKLLGLRVQMENDIGLDWLNVAEESIELLHFNSADEFEVGDPVYDTIIEGLTTTITSPATNVDGVLNVTGLGTFANNVKLLGQGANDISQITFENEEGVAVIGDIGIIDASNDLTIRSFNDGVTVEADGAAGQRITLRADGLGGVYVAGTSLFVEDFAESNRLELSHDGTDFYFTGQGVGDVNITGITGGLIIDAPDGITIAPAAAEPQLVMIDASGAANNTTWREIVDSAGLTWRLQARLDNLGGGSLGDAIVAFRSGSSVDRVEIQKLVIPAINGEMKIEDDRLMVWGTDFDLNMKYDSVDAMLEFNSSTAGVRMSSGIAFQIAAVGNEEHATFQHDETDFNTTFILTDDWNLIGLTNLDLGTANITNVGLVDGVDVSVHAADTDIHYSDAPADASNYVRNNNAWVLETVQEFGEYSGEFDASIGTFPVTTLSGDWFNCTVAGTVDSQPFIVGDLLVALINNPSTTVFAANWSLVPNISITDHTALTNIGVNTHAQIDTHLADAAIHFTEASIDHTAILNIGVNTHAQLDAHLADGTIHFLEGAIDHANILNIGVNTHAQIDTHIADGDIHFSDAPSDGNPYSRQDAAWVQTTGGAGLLSSQWRFSTTITDADPGNGRFRYNNATMGSVTAIFIDDLNNDGDDVSNFLALIQIGDRLYIQDAGDSADFQVWNVIADATDSGGYWEIGVALEVAGNDLSNNARSIVALVLSGATAIGDVFKVGGQNDNQIAVWTGDGTIEGTDRFQFDEVSAFLTMRANTSPGIGSAQSVAHLFTQADGALLSVLGFGNNADFQITNFNEGGNITFSGEDAGGVNIPFFILDSDRPGIRAEVPIYILEQAASGPSFANYGQFWVRDDTQTTAMFTNSFGNDRELIGSDGSGGSSRIAFFDGDVEIVGDANFTYGFNGNPEQMMVQVVTNTVNDVGILIIDSDSVLNPPGWGIMPGQAGIFDGSLFISSDPTDAVNNRDLTFVPGNRPTFGFGIAVAPNTSLSDENLGALAYYMPRDNVGTHRAIMSYVSNSGSGQASQFSWETYVYGNSGLQLRRDAFIKTNADYFTEFLWHGVMRFFDTSDNQTNFSQTTYLNLEHDGDDVLFSGANIIDYEFTDASGSYNFDNTIKAASYIQLATATDAELNAVANAINTDAGKVQGAMLYNTDQDIPVWAVGNADADIWVDGAGATINTPV